MRAAASPTAGAPPRRGPRLDRTLRGALGVGVPLLAVWYALYRALAPLADLVTQRLLGLSPDAPLGSAVRFFLYEAPKVLLLLVLVVFGVGVLRSFFTVERTRRLLAGHRESTGNVLAALLGVATPFCSCSAVPLFIGFVSAGVPLGVTFSFLIAAPMVNEVALVLLLATFGWRVALLYAGTGLLVALGAGWVIGRLRLERWVEPWVLEVGAEAASPAAAAAPTWALRLAAGREAIREVVGKVWPYVLAGIAVGAGIHGWVPQQALAGVLGRQAWWSVPLAVLIGIPLYSNAAGVVPVIAAMLDKGAALGTSLAFVMSVIGLSLPEMVILRKVLRPPLIAVFCGVVGAGILLVGYLFNLVL